MLPINRRALAYFAGRLTGALLLAAVLLWVTGCGITAGERCAQAQQALAIAQALPPSESRASRIAIYEAIIKKDCIAP